MSNSLDEMVAVMPQSVARISPGNAESGAAESSLDYMPQLDGLRAVAVTAVMFHHFDIVHGAASYGVHLFFVLSGFLITGILVRSKAAIDSGLESVKHALRRFYVRRTLRIFPLYYAVVLIGIAVNAESAREYAPWLLTYMINLKMAAQGWYIANFAHLWSLAVEEQFYLVWPFLVLIVRRRWLVWVAILMTAIGPLYRLYLAISWEYLASETSIISSYIATPSALDSLGAGSLVAIMVATEAGRLLLRRWMRLAVPFSGLLLAVLVYFTHW